MTLIEHAPAADDILDFVHSSLRQLQEAGVEAKYILVGTDSYEALRTAISTRFDRPEGTFETYQYLPIVLDPARTDTVLVLPAPSVCADGVQIIRVG